jgi:hypothetical protein
MKFSKNKIKIKRKSKWIPISKFTCSSVESFWEFVECKFAELLSEWMDGLSEDKSDVFDVAVPRGVRLVVDGEIFVEGSLPKTTRSLRVLHFLANKSRST